MRVESRDIARPKVALGATVDVDISFTCCGIYFSSWRFLGSFLLKRKHYKMIQYSYNTKSLTFRSAVVKFVSFTSSSDSSSVDDPSILCVPLFMKEQRMISTITQTIKLF